MSEPERYAGMMSPRRRDDGTLAPRAAPLTPPVVLDVLLRNTDLTNAASALWNAVIAIWEHTEKHTTYVEGVGYTSRSDQQTCGDAAEHVRLAAAEGKAWHDYRAIFSPSRKPIGTCVISIRRPRRKPSPPKGEKD